MFVNTWSLLDMTALGRQENWEDSPEGYPQSPPYEWWTWHDSYEQHVPSRWFGEPDPNDPSDQRPPRADAQDGTLASAWSTISDQRRALTASIAVSPPKALEMTMSGCSCPSSSRLAAQLPAPPRPGTRNVVQVPSPAGNIVSPVNSTFVPSPSVTR